MTLVDSIVSLGVVTVLAGVAVPFLITARDGSQVVSQRRGIFRRRPCWPARGRCSTAQQLAYGSKREAKPLPLSRSMSTVTVTGFAVPIVASGVDRPLGGFQRLQDAYPLVRFELDPAVPPVAVVVAGGGQCTDPVRLGQGDTLTFSPLGSATSGSLVSARAIGSPMRAASAREQPAGFVCCASTVGASAWSER